VTEGVDVRELHVLGVSADGRYVLLGASAGAARPSHRLVLDDRLRLALRGDLGPPGTGEVQSSLSPREIQTRLRAGETPEGLAREAGVPVTRVLRYAGPVLSERARVIDEARACTMRRPRRGESAVALGTAVDTHLAALNGVHEDTVSWVASRRPDGRWVVGVAYHSRGRQRRAEWLWEAHDHQVSPLDANAMALGYLDAPPPSEESAKPARRTAAKRAGRAAKKGAAAAKPKTRAATKSPAATSTPARGPAKRATKPAATKRTATKRTATKRTAAPTRTTATKRPTSTKRTPATKRTAATKPAATKRTAKAAPAPAQRRGRASVPSWSDVLLGGSPPAARAGRRRRG
jgi:hypothetical protein